MRLDERITWVSSSGMRLDLATIGTPIQLADVRGLDGLEQEIYTAKGSGQAGVSVTGSSITERAVEIDFSIARNDLPYRRELLRAFRPSATPGRLVFRRGSDVWHIAAYVEQAPRFTSGVMTTGTLALLCPAPAILSGDGDSSELKEIAQWIDNIEFDFGIPEDGHELAYRSPALIVDVENQGDMDAGCTIVFTTLGAVSNPVLVNAQTGERLSLTIDLLAGDILTVETGYGVKRVTLHRNGEYINAFNTLDAGSAWLQMRPGDNFIRYDAAHNVDNIEVRIYYNSAYSGV